MERSGKTSSPLWAFISVGQGHKAAISTRWVWISWCRVQVWPVAGIQQTQGDPVTVPGTGPPQELPAQTAHLPQSLGLTFMETEATEQPAGTRCLNNRPLFPHGVGTGQSSVFLACQMDGFPHVQVLIWHKAGALLSLPLQTLIISDIASHLGYI